MRSVTYRSIREKAKSLAAELGIIGFKASRRFVQLFCKRNQLTYRRVTHVAQEKKRNGAESCSELCRFFNQFEAVIKTSSFDFLINMDESPFYFDSSDSRTIEEIGARSIQTNNTGNDKTRFTFVVTITSRGDVWPGFLIFKGKYSTFF